GQYHLTEAVALRLGYSFNQNPIRNSVTFFNLESPGIYQHGIHFGASVQVTKAIAMHASYVHAIVNSIEGPFYSFSGPVPGTDLNIRQIADSFTVGVSVQF